MGYTIDELHNMTYEELLNVKAQDITERPPVRGIGAPYTVGYSCKHCNKQIEGSERSVSNLKNAKPVICPYCGGVLWSPESRNCLRRSAFKPGHFALERKKRYLKYLKDRAKRTGELHSQNRIIN